MKRTPKILYYVQHLLGVGHVFRTMRIVKILVQRGFDVELIYGGEKLPQFDDYGAKVHFLPSLVTAKGDFSHLLTAQGVLADDQYKCDRRDRLLTILAQAKPDIIVTEAFPFGRRQMHFELLPFMEAAAAMQKRPLIFASVRDILQEGNKPSKDQQTVALLKTYFDGILVHADPNLIALDATFPLTEEIATLINYTGIVAPDIIPNLSGVVPEFDVVVSVGGGMLGRELVSAAVEAKSGSTMQDARWCVLTGPFMDADFSRQLFNSDIVVREFLPDLPQVLAGAKLSISLAGYNTVADIMAAGCRAIIAPQWNDKETEQLRRTQLLAERNLVEMLSHEQKNPENIREAIRRIMQAPPPDWQSIDTCGAHKSADILEKAYLTSRQKQGR